MAAATATAACEPPSQVLTGGSPLLPGLQAGDDVLGRVCGLSPEGCWLDVAGVTDESLTFFLPYATLGGDVDLRVGDDLCGLQIVDISPEGRATLSMKAPLLMTGFQSSASSTSALRGRGRGAGRGGKGCGRQNSAISASAAPSAQQISLEEHRERQSPDGQQVELCYSRRVLLSVREAMRGAGPQADKQVGALPKLLAPSKSELDRQLLEKVKVGELPQHAWKACSMKAKKAGLIEALRRSHMHIVYAMQPESDAFRDGLQCVELNEAFLHLALQTLCEDARAAGRTRPSTEATAWLLEREAPVLLLLPADSGAERIGGLQLLAQVDPLITSRPNILQEVVLCTRDRDQKVRRAAVETMGRINAGQPTRVVSSALAGLLRDADHLVREAAAVGLGASGEEGIIAAAAVLSDTDEMACGLAAKAILWATAAGGEPCKVRAVPCIETFIAWLDLHGEGQHPLRLLAAQTLGAIGEYAGAKAAKALARSVQTDMEADVREAAVIALAALGTPGAAFVEVVTSALDDSSPFVQEAAAASFEVMGSRLQ